jgi:hypothetical protein
MAVEKTGAELNALLLGDAQHLELATDYPMSVDSIRVGVSFPFADPTAVEPDDGARTINRVVTVTPAEMAAGLDVTQRQALLELVASKL